MIVVYGKNGKIVKSVKRIITGFTLFTQRVLMKILWDNLNGNKMKRHDFGGQWMNCCIIMNYF